MDNNTIKELAKKRLEYLHNDDISIKILYQAIESCSNEDFIYARDIIFDGFLDNENLVKEVNGKFYFSFTDILFTDDIDVSYFDKMISDIIDANSDDEFDINLDEDVTEIDFWTDIEYKRYLCTYFYMCMLRIDIENRTMMDIDYN